MGGSRSGFAQMQRYARCLRECGVRGVRKMMVQRIGFVNHAKGGWSMRLSSLLIKSLVCLLLCLSLNVTIAAVGNAYAATASWTAVSDPELQGYKLYRAPGACANPGAFATIQTYGLVTNGSVPNPSTNGTYCHRLTAFNAAGESPFSNTSEFKYVVNPPAAPQNFSVKP